MTGPPRTAALVSPSEISRADRLRLAALVEEHLSRFTERDVLQVLRHPHLTAPVVELVLASRSFSTLRSVRKLVAMHPAAPRPEALRCLEDLLWRDLVDVGREPRTPMPVRAAANQKILEKLPRLTVGEKTALARAADRQLFRPLLQETAPAVFSALLRNPRLASDDLLAWVAGSPDAARLSLLAADPRWISRPGIRGALLLSRALPRAAALGLLSSASRAEWRRLADDPAADPLLAACARRLHDEGTRPSGQV